MRIQPKWTYVRKRCNQEESGRRTENQVEPVRTCVWTTTKITPHSKEMLRKKGIWQRGKDAKKINNFLRDFAAYPCAARNPTNPGPYGNVVNETTAP